jgi:hypothetical protein
MRLDGPVLALDCFAAPSARFFDGPTTECEKPFKRPGVYMRANQRIGNRRHDL